jgi:hypothetical protein
MGGTSKDDWDQVGQRFGELKDRLAERYRAHGAKATEGGEAASAESAETPGSSETAESAEERRRKIDEALRTARDQLDRTFTTVGATIRDPETRESLNRAFSSLGSALASTLSEAGDGIRRTFGSRSETDPTAEGSDTKYVGSDPKDAGSDPKDAGSDPNAAGSDSKDEPTA